MHLLWMLILVNVLGNCKADDPSFNNKSTSTPEEDSSMENMSVLVSLPCGGGSKTLALSVESACDVYVQAAVKLAGEYVNNRSRGVYRGREWRRMGVNVNIFDDKNGDDSTNTLSTYVNQTLQPKRTIRNLHGIVISGVSEVAEPIAYISGTKQSMVSVSYGAPDILFNRNRERFPYFHRTLPSEEAINIAKLKLLEELGWKRVALLSAGSPTYTRAMENFARLVADKSVNVTLSFVTRLSFDLEAVFEELIKRDVKIILGFFGPDDARKVLCQASTYMNGELLDESHVWILPQYYHPEWWEVERYDSTPLHSHSFTPCSPADMRRNLNHVLSVGSLNYNVQHRDYSDDTEVYHLDEDVDLFVVKLQDVVHQLYNFTAPSSNTFLRQSRAAASYDALVLLAIALNQTVSSGVNNSEMSRRLNTTLSDLKLDGLAKFHHLNISQDFRFNVLVTQFVGDGRNTTKAVCVISGEVADASCSQCEITYLTTTNWTIPGLRACEHSNFTWRGNSRPSDGFLVIKSHISVRIFIITGVILFVSLLISIVYMMALLMFYSNRYMKATSPKLTMVVILGFISVLPTPIIYGLTVSRSYYNIGTTFTTALCIIDPILVNTGFILAFSIILVKNWRIYRIFHNPRNNSLRHMSDVYLLGQLVALILPYLCILLAWLVSSTPRSMIETVKISPTTKLKFTFCGDTRNLYGVWLAALGLYELLILAMLLYISYKNSSIPNHLRAHAEEGQGATRMVIVVTVITLASIFTFNILHIDFHNNYVGLFWAHVMYSTVSPILYLSVIFIPKFIMMHQDHRHKLKEHRQLKRHQQLSRRMMSMQIEADLLKSDLEEKEQRIEDLRRTRDSLMTSVSGPLSPGAMSQDSFMSQ